MDDDIKDWHVAYVIKAIINKTAKTDKGQMKPMDPMNSTAL